MSNILILIVSLIVLCLVLVILNYVINYLQFIFYEKEKEIRGFGLFH